LLACFIYIYIYIYVYIYSAFVGLDNKRNRVFLDTLGFIDLSALHNDAINCWD